MTHRFLIVLLMAAVHPGAAVGQEPDAETLRFIETRVRPLLESRCLECHGAEMQEPKGGLRLHSRAAALKGGDSGPAIVPGKPEESLLIEAINYESFEMPPRSRLPDGEIAILTEWVRRGAPLPARGPEVAVAAEPFPLKQRMQEHWAWAPLTVGTVPQVRDKDWPRDEIDSFILARLEKAGLRPAQAADRRTLIRRLYFDLIGLPPTVKQVRAFLNDPRDDRDATAAVVDELLASDHFGERWARHWLDLVRYAETLGHEFDYPLHHAHEYRNYVIRAFNADVPYDQFAIEHIAGDLLTDPRRHPTEDFNESLIGTGFWFLGEAKHAPVDVRGEEAAMMDNQIDVFSKTFLALTVSCARCHDHKFDAISAADYYALAGLLQSSMRQVGMLDPGRRIERSRERIDRLLNEAGTKIQNEITRKLNELQPNVIREWAAKLARDGRDPASPLFALTEASSVTASAFPDVIDTLAERVDDFRQRAAESRKNYEQFASFDDGLPPGWSFVGEGFARPTTTGTEWDWQSPGVRRRARGVASSAHRGPQFQGILRSPVFELKHDQVIYHTRGDDTQVRVIIEGYRMDEFNGLLFSGARQTVKTDGKFRWVRHAADVSRYKGARCHLEFIDQANGQIEIDEVGFANGGPDPLPFPSPATTTLLSGKPGGWTELCESAVALARQGVDGRTRAGTELVNAMIADGLIDIDESAFAATRDQLAELSKQTPKPRHVIAISDGSAENERLFIRGSHRNLGDVVPRRMLEAFDSPEIDDASGSGRLEVARALFRSDNPFPARVMVNRIWHHLLGRGLVASTDNFGVLGQRPSHPELLDYLADAFRRDGWSMKRMIKRIVMTRTYQQASAANPQAASVDPANVLLHRASVRRLQGEAVRDALLTVSGRLDRTLYGGSVPLHLTNFMQGRGRPRSGPLDGNGRRSIYIRIHRNFLSPLMLAFDTPIPFTTIGRRSNSNVPAQALILMNDPFVAQQAELWAKNTLAGDSDAERRFRSMYESAFAREPTNAELNRGLAFLRAQGAGWERDLTAWKDLAHVLINTKEFIFLR